MYVRMYVLKVTMTRHKSVANSNGSISTLPPLLSFDASQTID